VADAANISIACKCFYLSVRYSGGFSEGARGACPPLPYNNIF